MMPFSDVTAHPVISAVVAEALQGTESPWVLDCGVGCGLTGAIVRRVCPRARVVGLEIYAAYITSAALRKTQETQWGLHHHLYESLILGSEGDFRSYLPQIPTGIYALVLFGDSLEHVSRIEGIAALREARRIAPSVIVSTPCEREIDGVTYCMPQEAAFGNAHEAHVTHWRREELEALGLRYVGEGQFAMVFVA